GLRIHAEKFGHFLGSAVLAHAGSVLRHPVELSMTGACATPCCRWFSAWARSADHDAAGAQRFWGRDFPRPRRSGNFGNFTCSQHVDSLSPPCWVERLYCAYCLRVTACARRIGSHASVPGSSLVTT